MHGRNLRRTIRHLGHPSHEVLVGWIDELASGERRLQVNEIPEVQRRQAVLAVVAGGVKSREAAESLGVNSADARETGSD